MITSQKKYTSCLVALAELLEMEFNGCHVVTGMNKDYSEFTKGNTVKNNDVFFVSWNGSDVLSKTENGKMTGLFEQISIYYRITTTFYSDAINRMNDVVLALDESTYYDERLNNRTLSIDSVIPVENNDNLTVFLINIEIV